jgi:cation diffusion facilitator CzcD-associated flavoprotein CzcO
MKLMRQNVAIIGCGASGLVTLKELIAEGHTGTIFERAIDIGGIFKTAYRDGQMVSSTIVTMFSDFLGSEGERILTHPRMLTFGKFISSVNHHQCFF